MLVPTENGMLLKIEDTNPEQRYKRIARAIVAAVRWHGFAPKDQNYNEMIEGDNLIVLSDLMDCLLCSTLVNERDICIELIDQGDEVLSRYIRALVAAVRWSIHERRFCDNQNLIEIAKLIEELTDKTRS